MGDPLDVFDFLDTIHGPEFLVTLIVYALFLRCRPRRPAGRRARLNESGR